jgi:hypothetical protein
MGAGWREENAPEQKTSGFRARPDAGAKPIALCAACRYIVTTLQKAALAADRATMRAETERLVEEIKQSVGLLRRHL